MRAISSSRWMARRRRRSRSWALAAEEEVVVERVGRVLGLGLGFEGPPEADEEDEVPFWVRGGVVGRVLFIGVERGIE